MSSLQGNSYQAGFAPTTPPFDLNVGDLLTFNSSYTIVVNDISDGFLINQITASGTYGGNPITETSDDGDDSDGNNSDDETVVQVSQNPEVSIIKSVATDTSAGSAVSLGDLLTFTVIVENTGNINLENLSVQDNLVGYYSSVGLTLTTGPSFVGSDGPNNNDQTKLNIGEKATYTATFEINQAAIDDQGVSNRFYMLQNGNVLPDRFNQTSGSVDDGNDDDSNRTSTDVVIPINSKIKAVKTSDFSATDNGNGILDAGETLVYTIAVENTGNVTLDNVQFSDELVDVVNGNKSFLDELTDIVYDYDLKPDGTQIQASSQIAPGHIAFYRAELTITQEIVNYGGIKNRVEVTAEDPLNNSVIDLSDDGDIFDGGAGDVM